MKRNLEVGSVLKFFKICGRLSLTWPLDPDAQIRERVIKELMWWASILNIVGLIVPLILAVYHHRLQPGTFMKSFSELTAIMGVFANLILCKNQRHRLQVKSVMK